MHKVEVDVKVTYLSPPRRVRRTEFFWSGCRWARRLFLSCGHEQVESADRVHAWTKTWPCRSCRALQAP